MYEFNYDAELPVTFKHNGEPVKIGSVWVAEKPSDVDKLRAAGRPYIRFNGGKEKLIKLLILPFLMSKFPAIKWMEVLGLKSKQQVLINVPGCECDSSYPTDKEDNGKSDMATSERTFSNTGQSLPPSFRQCYIEDYIGQASAFVDIVKLQQMELLPKFLDKIVEATLAKADDLRWQEGYNKKLGLCAGNYNDLIQARNLLIIDVSASIPRGVSSTMLALADSLREQMKADLIVTGGTSKFWEYGEELPTPQQLRDMIPLGNESFHFKNILRNHIVGKQWDNVVAFGDYDNPGVLGDTFLTNNEVTNVGKLYSFRVPPRGWHGSDLNDPVGYSRWIGDLGCQYEYESDTEWVRSIKER